MGDNTTQSRAAQRDGDTITLSTGKVLTIDLHRITMREWRQAFSVEATIEQQDSICAKILNVSADDLVDLPQPDYRFVMKAIIEAATRPLENPNSASASTLG